MCTVTIENYDGEGLMVKCPTAPEAGILAEEKAKELGKELQNCGHRSLFRNNQPHWFFRFAVEDNRGKV